MVDDLELIANELDKAISHEDLVELGLLPTPKAVKVNCNGRSNGKKHVGVKKVSALLKSSVKLLDYSPSVQKEQNEEVNVVRPTRTHRTRSRSSGGVIILPYTPNMNGDNPLWKGLDKKMLPCPPRFNGSKLKELTYSPERVQRKTSWQKVLPQDAWTIELSYGTTRDHLDKVFGSALKTKQLDYVKRISWKNIFENYSNVLPSGKEAIQLPYESGIEEEAREKAKSTEKKPEKKSFALTALENVVNSAQVMMESGREWLSRNKREAAYAVAGVVGGVMFGGLIGLAVNAGDHTRLYDSLRRARNKVRSQANVILGQNQEMKKQKADKMQLEYVNEIYEGNIKVACNYADLHVKSERFTATLDRMRKQRIYGGKLSEWKMEKAHAVANSNNAARSSARRLSQVCYHGNTPLFESH